MKAYKIRIPEGCSQAAQKKAFKLGYEWNEDGNVVQPFDIRELYLEGVGGIGWNPLVTASNRYFDDQDDYEELSYGEFMALPVEEDISPKGKTDAYVTGVAVSTTTLMTPNGWVHVSAYDLHKYNLMSEEEFKAKHQPKLKFKEWEVTVNSGIAKVGCKEFGLDTLRQFIVTYDRIDAYADVKEAINFMRNHKKELGL